MGIFEKRTFVISGIEACFAASSLWMTLGQIIQGQTIGSTKNQRCSTMKVEIYLPDTCGTSESPASSKLSAVATSLAFFIT